MAEEQQVMETQATETKEVAVDNSTALADAWLGETTQVVSEAPKQEQQQEEQPKAEAPKEEEQIFDEKDWIKNTFGFESKEDALKEFNALKELRNKKTDAVSFADEQSKLIYEHLAKGNKKEVRQFLETQERLESLTAAEVNKDTAEEIIKLSMSLKYKDLTQKEIDYKFNREYGIPKEPVQQLTETEDEFASRKHEWSEKVEDVLTNMVIEAKLSKPELSKLKSELVLPEINKETQQQPQQLSQKDLDAIKAERESFIQFSEQSIGKFSGFSAAVKDKDVDYTVSYTPSQEEKTNVQNVLKRFAEYGYDANAVLGERWVDFQTNTIKVEQIQEDLLTLFSRDKIMQKMAADSKGKAIEAYLKEKKNVNLNTGSTGTFTPSGEKTQHEAMADAFLAV